MKPKITLITVSFHSESEIISLLEQLGGSDRPEHLEVVVVSNAGDCHALETRFRCQVVQAGGNVGFARACNRGAEGVRSDILLFCDPDVQISLEAIDALAAVGMKNPQFGLLAPRVGASVQVSPTLVATETNERVMGACVAIRTPTFHRVGGWDERFFLWHEDRDLCDRLRARGLLVGHLDGVTIVHQSEHAVQGISPGERRYLTRVWISSQIYYRCKHFGRLAAMGYCVLQVGMNLFRLAVGKRNAPGRSYHDPAESIRFGLWMLTQIPSLPRCVAFDGVRFGWGGPGDLIGSS